jgi:hypothetical protein
MNNQKSNWGQCGLPSQQTIELRNSVAALVSTYLTARGFNSERDFAIGAGFKCVILELYAPLAPEQEIEMKRIFVRTIPLDHTFQIWKEYETGQ